MSVTGKYRVTVYRADGTLAFQVGKAKFVESNWEMVDILLAKEHLARVDLENLDDGKTIHRFVKDPLTRRVTSWVGTKNPQTGLYEFPQVQVVNSDA